MKNRFSRCLVYVIGEIVLVVFGILIALKISNCNISEKVRSFEVEMLKEIK